MHTSFLNNKYLLNNKNSISFGVRKGLYVMPKSSYTTMLISDGLLPVAGPLQAFTFLLVVGLLLKNIPFILKPSSKDIDQSLEKNSAYECGVTPFAIKDRGVGYESLSHAMFFIIMDLEILFAIPFAKGMDSETILVTLFYFILVFFLYVLCFSYDWKVGAISEIPGFVKKNVRSRTNLNRACLVSLGEKGDFSVFSYIFGRSLLSFKV